MKTVDDLIREIFLKVKRDKTVHYQTLIKTEGTARINLKLAYTKLTKEYKLLNCTSQVFTLSEKGELHDTVDLYLESLKPKKSGLTKYQKIQLPIYIILGLITATFAFLNYRSNNAVDSQKDKYNLLESDFAHYRDSVNALNIKIATPTLKTRSDTSKTKNLDSLKN